MKRVCCDLFAPCGVGGRSAIGNRGLTPMAIYIEPLRGSYGCDSRLVFCDLFDPCGVRTETPKHGFPIPKGNLNGPWAQPTERKRPAINDTDPAGVEYE